MCRVVYVWQNWAAISLDLQSLDPWLALKGCLVFDTSAICYTLGIYALLMLLPLPVRRKDWYQTVCKWYFLIICSLCIIANLADSVYFPYAQRRTTTATLLEFGNESAAGIFRICAIETARNWYLVLFAALLVATLCLLYRKDRSAPRRIIPSVLLWAACIPLIAAGIRGGITRQTRPINIGNAMRYVATPAQAAAILNTPFTFIRNIGNRGYTLDPAEQSDQISFPSIHQPCDGIWHGKVKPNVFIIIVESLSQEFIGAYNDYPCGTPFLDSLRSVSLSPSAAFANGNKSIDALPSILCGIPRLEEHLLLTPYANNHFCSVVSELAKQGYSSAFFHGATAGSMGFDAFASGAGVKNFYSLEDYCRDSRFAGKADFDGHWAIWDEEFLQFTALHAADMPEPFVGTVFTASSHHPFMIPEKHSGRFNRSGNPMYNCISYTDYSLREFFRTASGQPWYDHTIFILTADHTSSVCENERYLSDEWGRYRIPLIIFDPSGTLPRGVIQNPSQQSDIFPTVMGITGTKDPYVAFGKDILSEDSGDWVYVYMEKHCALNADSLFIKSLERDYKSRMIDNRMKIY